MPRASTTATGEPTFADRAQQAAFDRDGFVRLDGLDLGVIADLGAALAPLVRPVAPLFSLYRGDDPRLRAELDAAVRPLMARLLDGRLVGQRLFLGSVLVKFPDPDGLLGLHQDWTFVDEPAHRSGLVWVPLRDVAPDDGALRVVPGSHRLAVTGRGIPVEPVPIDPARHLLEQRAIPVACPLGSAIAYDHRIVHGSLPNLGPEPRVAAVVAFAPEGADLVHHCADAAGTPTRLHVEPTFFQEYEPGGPVPDHQVIERSPAGPRAEPVTAAAASRALRPGRLGRFRARPRR